MKRYAVQRLIGLLLAIAGLSTVYYASKSYAAFHSEYISDNRAQVAAPVLQISRKSLSVVNERETIYFSLDAGAQDITIGNLEPKDEIHYIFSIDNVRSDGKKNEVALKVTMSITAYYEQYEGGLLSETYYLSAANSIESGQVKLHFAEGENEREIAYDNTKTEVDYSNGYLVIENENAGQESSRPITHKVGFYLVPAAVEEVSQTYHLTVSLREQNDIDTVYLGRLMHIKIQVNAEQVN